MTSPRNSDSRAHRSRWACPLVAIVICGLLPPSPGHAAGASRAETIAAELNIPRRAWTICTVNEIGRAVETGRLTDPVAIADGALAHCSDRKQALRAKATELLGADAAERLMARLEAEARDALIGSARTLAATKAGGSRIDPAWPRVLPSSN